MDMAELVVTDEEIPAAPSDCAGHARAHRTRRARLYSRRHGRVVSLQALLHHSVVEYKPLPVLMSDAVAAGSTHTYASTIIALTTRLRKGPAAAECARSHGRSLSRPWHTPPLGVLVVFWVRCVEVELNGRGAHRDSGETEEEKISPFVWVSYPFFLPFNILTSNTGTNQDKWRLHFKVVRTKSES
jgi:hypothetical protein